MDNGLSWAQAQYDRAEGPDPCGEDWGYTDGESNSGNQFHPAYSND